MSLFVLKQLSNGLYVQTGYSEGTPDLQSAAIYSPKGRRGWMLDADPEVLKERPGGGYELIRVEVVPK